jgi:hypothetical protein
MITATLCQYTSPSLTHNTSCLENHNLEKQAPKTSKLLHTIDQLCMQYLALHAPTGQLVTQLL